LIVALGTAGRPSGSCRSCSQVDSLLLAAGMNGHVKEASMKKQLKGANKYFKGWWA
jgi:hypothetical protein